MPTVTAFDTEKRYIFIPTYITTKTGAREKFDAILDCGAPSIELSDRALQLAGFLETPRDNVQLKPGQATQKYDKICLPKIEVCSHTMTDLSVYVSHFDESWGIDALIGLDFFRRFEVKVNYKYGRIVTMSLLDT